MSLHYNLQSVTGHRIASIYDLSRAGIIATATCTSIFRQKPIQTDTLFKVLSYIDCSLDQFLSYEPEQPESISDAHRLNLSDMVERGVISRTSQKRFRTGKPMSLSTLVVMAEDQKVNLMDFLREEALTVPDGKGGLKKERKVLYLTEW